MKHRVCSLAVAVFCLILAVAGNAAAEHCAGSFMLSPGIGHFGFDSDLNLEDNLAYEFSLGYNFTDHLGLELSYSYTDTESIHHVLNRDGKTADADVSFGQLNALYHFTTANKNLVPYLAVGAGAFSYDFKHVAGNSGSTEFATNVGGGVKYFVHKNVALRADVRNVQTYPECSWLASAGVTVYLGGCKKKAEAEAAAPQPQAKPEAAAVDQGKIDFEKEDIHFAFDKSDLTPEAQSILKRKAAWLSGNPKATVSIEGNCDERGTNEYNMALGERRAVSARNFLVNLGTDASRLTTVSYGEERPLDPGHNEEAWAKNRRDHFVLK